MVAPGVSGGSMIGFSSSVNRMRSGAGDIADFRKKFPKIVEIALQRTFKYWLQNFAPHHFEKYAFSRYAKEYDAHWKRNPQGKRKRRLASAMRRGVDTDRPLVKTGALKQAFLGGSYRFDKLPGNSGIRALWLDLPKYSYMFKYVGGGGTTFKIQDALTAVSDSEYEILGRVFEKYLQEEINREDPASRSRGVMAFG